MRMLTPRIQHRQLWMRRSVPASTQNLHQSGQEQRPQTHRRPTPTQMHPVAAQKTSPCQVLSPVRRYFKQQRCSAQNGLTNAPCAWWLLDLLRQDFVHVMPIVDWSPLHFPRHFQSAIDRASMCSCRVMRLWHQARSHSSTTPLCTPAGEDLSDDDSGSDGTPQVAAPAKQSAKKAGAAPAATEANTSKRGKPDKAATASDSAAEAQAAKRSKPGKAAKASGTSAAERASEPAGATETSGDVAPDAGFFSAAPKTTRFSAATLRTWACRGRC